jgi:hypothetical protein
MLDRSIFDLNYKFGNRSDAGLRIVESSKK